MRVSRFIVVFAVAVGMATGCGPRYPAVVPAMRVAPDTSDPRSLEIVRGEIVGGSWARWNGIAVLGTFTRGDLEAMVAVVTWHTHAASRRDKTVLSIAQRGDAYVEVETGYICGGLCGNGLLFRLRKIEGRWTVVEQLTWES